MILVASGGSQCGYTLISEVSLLTTVPGEPNAPSSALGSKKMSRCQPSAATAHRAVISCALTFAGVCMNIILELVNLSVHPAFGFATVGVCPVVVYSSIRGIISATVHLEGP